MLKSLAALVLATSLTACVSTGDPTTDRFAVGAAGGAVAGQLLGGDTGSTLAGAVIGGMLGGATAPRQATQSTVRASQAHPCADIARRTDLDPEAKADLCDARLYPVR